MTKPKKNYGVTNRRKGHSAERAIAQDFRAIGFLHCKTSRQASRLLDDSKIDLAFIPYNIQIKAGKQRGLNPIKELKAMEVEIIKNYPPGESVHSNPNLVLLKKEVGQGIKRSKYDTTITMAYEDFLKIVKKLNTDLKNDL